MGQSKGWFLNLLSLTPSRAFFTLGESVYTSISFATGLAHAATGFGDFANSTKHIRQFPAINKRSW